MIRVRNQVGTQSGTSKALQIFAVAAGEELQRQQVDKDFIATGKTLDSYVVLVEPRNKVSLNVAPYFHTFVEGWGRRPGELPPINELMKWIDIKGIVPDKGDSINSLAWKMGTFMKTEGNQVFRGERPGIVIEESIDLAWRLCKDEVGLFIAQDAANQMVQAYYKSLKK